MQNRTTASGVALVVIALGLIGCDLFSGSGGRGGGAPGTPTNLTVGVPTPLWVSLSWSASSGATSYQAYRDTTSNGSFSTRVYSGTDTSCLDLTVAPGGTYYYRVVASNSSGSSGLSAPVIGTAIGTIPWVPGVDDTVWYVTNDATLQGSIELFNIDGSTLALNQTLTTSVNQISGMGESGIGVIFFLVDAANYWMFLVWPGPSGWYEIYQKVNNAWNTIASAAATTNEMGTANVLSVSYTKPSALYQLAFSINGGLTYTYTSNTAVAGAGGTTGFVGQVSTDEVFPTLPLWDTFAQTSPVAFSGSTASAGASLMTPDRVLIRPPGRSTPRIR